jgi:hypothetical protein
MNTEGNPSELFGQGTDAKATGLAGSDARPAKAVVLVVAAFLLAVALLIFLIAAPKSPLPDWNRPILGREALVIFLALLAAVPGLALVRISLHKTRGKIMRGVKRLVLCLIASIVSIAAFDLLLGAYPDLQTPFFPERLIWPLGKFGNVEDDHYGFRGEPNVNATFIFDPEKDGGLAMRERRWPPTGEKKNAFTIVRDANGFPNSAVPNSADWVVMGDSFALELRSPDGKQWITTLHDEVKGGLYDIAVSGWGPECEFWALEEYGFPLKPRVVVWSFFEGNDLADVAFFRGFKAFQWKTGLGWADYIAKEYNFPPPRFPYNRPVVKLLLAAAQLLNPPAKIALPGVDPVILTTAGHSSPQAFHPSMFMQMGMAREHLGQWFNWQVAEYDVSKAIDMCKERGITFVLLFFPDKAHVYLPLMEQQIDREKFYNLISPSLPKDWGNDANAYYERVNQNAANVSELLKELCRKKDVVFIDTTESLRNAVKEGVFPYWSYDTHLNLDGHKIVAKTILEQLRQANLLPPSE